ncbi:MAG: methyltransferase type 11 [Acidobacteria bacterium]|nr:MAG: methyltransferase type 11 [Acidobacteriota bacterium]
MNAQNVLDSPEREAEVRAILRSKGSLRALYREYYNCYLDVLNRTPAGGDILELGSGAGFVKEVIPEMITSDVIPYSGIDRVIDATQLPFADHSLRAVFLMNVFHHTSNVEKLLSELNRCLKIDGRALMIDQYPGIPARWIYRYLHHEPYDPNANAWQFTSGGPVSGANGALAWIVFERDRTSFVSKFPELKIERFETHTPLRYWLTGGLRRWTLLPISLYPFASAFDSLLIAIWKKFGSFVNIELRRTG